MDVLVITSRGTIERAGRCIQKDGVGITRRHTYVASNPLIYAVSLPNVFDVTRIIEASKQFAAQQVIDPGAYEDTALGRKPLVDVIEAETIDCPLLKHSNWHIECEVIETIPCGDHTLFIGQVRKRVL